MPPEPADEAPGAAPPGVVLGAPRALLQAEGALVLAASAFAYARAGDGWLMFALLFFAPDLFMLGYLAGPRLGAVVYNVGHTYLAPAALAAAGWSFDRPTALALALIWVAHIGFDRMLGFGLKYPAAFGRTHLSRA